MTHTRPTITLSVTVHEPDERLMPMIEAHLPDLASRYAAIVARCSPQTHSTVRELLQRQGATVLIGPDRPEGIHNLGAIRLETVRAALRTGSAFIHLCDFDRAVHWVAHYAEELDEVLAEIPNYDLLVLGRTERAWATHPAYQFETEPLFNHVFGLVTGLPWDIGAGSRGFSRRAAETLSLKSRDPSVGTDAEWPLILLEQEDCGVYHHRRWPLPRQYRAGFRTCEGLEFETADRFGPEIEAAGGYEAWETQMNADPQRWVFRMRLALLIAEAAIGHGRER